MTTASRNRVQDLLLRMQSAFLENPTLSLTLPAAGARFGIDEATGAGVLGALVDAGVLTERGGTYRRYFHDLRGERHERSTVEVRRPDPCADVTRVRQQHV